MIERLTTAVHLIGAVITIVAPTALIVHSAAKAFGII